MNGISRLKVWLDTWASRAHQLVDADTSVVYTTDVSANIVDLTGIPSTAAGALNKHMGRLHNSVFLT